MPRSGLKVGKGTFQGGGGTNKEHECKSATLYKKDFSALQGRKKKKKTILKLHPQGGQQGSLCFADCTQNKKETLWSLQGVSKCRH